MKKLNFNFDITGATAINIQPDERREIVQAAIRAPKLFDTVTLLEYIKSGDAIPLLDFTPSFVAGLCGYNSTNNVPVTDAVLNTVGIKADADLCPSDLAKTAFERFLPDGVKNEIENLSFEDVLAAFMVKKYGREIQRLALVGKTVNSDPLDGLITKAYATGSGVGSVTLAAPTTTNALNLLFDLYDAMDDEILEPEARPTIIVGMDWVRKAAIQAFNDNRFAYNFQVDEKGGFVLPTTNVRVEGFSELNGTNQALAGSGQFAFVGTDLEDDMSGVDIWYSRDFQTIRTTAKLRLGTALAFASKFVKAN